MFLSRLPALRLVRPEAKRGNPPLTERWGIQHMARNWGGEEGNRGPEEPSLGNKQVPCFCPDILVMNAKIIKQNQHVDIW